MNTTYLIRHRKENRKKCSLTPLEGREGFEFIRYPFLAPLPSFAHTLLLTPEAPPLSSEDRGLHILLVDATWRYAPIIIKALPPTLTRRSLPPQWATVYPRCQEVASGLASIEALYAAYHILGYPTEGLLADYYWREAFLEKNRALLID